MAETQNSEESTYHMKRKPDLNGEDSEEHSKKAPKLETFENNSLASEDKIEECEATPKSKNNLEVPNSNCSSVTEKKIEGIESEVFAREAGNEDDGDDDEVDNDDEDDNGDEDEDEDVDVDRKGKGIVRDDKGKGKLIEEEDEDEDDSGDDDSNDDGVVSDGDSDLSDDPLAEVDLNNILPSRTRRRTINTGVYIANDLPNDEDDDSDDSDA
ncbi:hypothetical protein L6164_004909 [Bauhinia variegata]|uniref:Uncharacterized protein n=1 Tax=Bauhinia variegata TaxID=167791 RepID=A0ACB9PR14_BAUVA|nr:hypothetical protein L6164_004909 [Bauhinia variegata]